MAHPRAEPAAELKLPADLPAGLHARVGPRSVHCAVVRGRLCSHGGQHACLFRGAGAVVDDTPADAAAWHGPSSSAKLREACDHCPRRLLLHPCAAPNCVRVPGQAPAGRNVHARDVHVGNGDACNTASNGVCSSQPHSSRAGKLEQLRTPAEHAPVDGQGRFGGIRGRQPGRYGLPRYGATRQPKASPALASRQRAPRDSTGARDANNAGRFQHGFWTTQNEFLEPPLGLGEHASGGQARNGSRSLRRAVSKPRCPKEGPDERQRIPLGPTLCGADLHPPAACLGQVQGARARRRGRCSLGPQPTRPAPPRRIALGSPRYSRHGAACLWPAA